METWRYKSLKWIHEVREKNYNQTKNLTPKELIEKTRKSVEGSIKNMRLKVVHSRTTH